MLLILAYLHWVILVWWCYSCNWRVCLCGVVCGAILVCACLLLIQIQINASPYGVQQKMRRDKGLRATRQPMIRQVD